MFKSTICLNHFVTNEKTKYLYGFYFFDNCRLYHCIKDAWAPEMCVINQTCVHFNTQFDCSKIHDQIVPFHNDISLSGEQPEHRILAHELERPTAGRMAIFHKFCCSTKRCGIKTNLNPRNHWEYVTDVAIYHNAGIWSMY